MTYPVNRPLRLNGNNLLNALKKFQFNEKLLFILPFCLIAYGFAGGLSNDIYLPAMPAMVSYFETTDSMIQLTLTAWGIGLGTVQLILGPWSDHYGRRPALIYGGLIFVVGSLLCAVATDPIFLLIARFIQGVGTCSIFTLVITVIKEVFPLEQRVKWLVYNNMIRSLAPLVGPVVGAYLVTFYSWRANFVLIFAIGAAMIFCLSASLPETKPREAGVPFSFKKILANYKAAVKHATLMHHIMASGTLFGGLIVYLTSGAFILIERVGLTPVQFGYSQVAISGAYLLGAFFVKKGYQKLGAHKVIVYGISASVLGAALMVLANIAFENVYTVLIPLALYSFGFGMASTPLAERALAQEGVQTGMIAGMIGFSVTLGSSLGSFIMSMVADTALITGTVMFAFALTARLVYLNFHIRHAS